MTTTTTNGTSDFCPDPIFDANLTWHTDNPNLTRCMRDTVLVAGPVAVFLLALVFHLADVVRRNRARSQFPPRRKPRPLLFGAKAALTVLLAANAAWEAAYRCVNA